MDLFLRVEVENYAMWLVMISQWSLIGVIVIAGPATAKIEKHGPFCEQSSYDLPPFHRFNDHI